MKKRMTTPRTNRFVLALCMVAALGTVTAQTSPSVPTLSRLEFLTNYLSLKDWQQAQAKTIFDAEEAAIKSAQTALQQAQAALTSAGKQGQSDFALDQLAATAGSAFANIAGSSVKAEKQFYAILTADQQTKYDKLATSGITNGSGTLTGCTAGASTCINGTPPSSPAGPTITSGSGTLPGCIPGAATCLNGTPPAKP